MVLDTVEMLHRAELLFRAAVHIVSTSFAYVQGTGDFFL